MNSPCFIVGLLTKPAINTIWSKLVLNFKTEIMVMRKETLEELQKAGILNELDTYRFKVAQRAGQQPLECPLTVMAKLAHFR